MHVTALLESKGELCGVSFIYCYANGYNSGFRLTSPCPAFSICLSKELLINPTVLKIQPMNLLYAALKQHTEVGTGSRLHACALKTFFSALHALFLTV